MKKVFSIKNNPEKKLLYFIKYGALFILISITIISTIIFINEREKSLKKDIAILEKSYITHNKEKIKSLVERIHQLIVLEKESFETHQKVMLKNEVNQAYDIINFIYNKNKKMPNYSREKTLNEIKETLRNFRFNSNIGYLFIYELDGKNIMNSEFPDIEGKNLWNYKDSKGTLLLQEMKKILSEKKETFYSWYWQKNKNDSTNVLKYGYFKTFEPYNIFIGASDYFTFYEDKIKEQVLKKINSFKFNKPEHIFIYDTDGFCLSNPQKELIGQNRIDVKNKDGKYVLKEQLDFVKKNEQGYITYKGSVVLNNKLKTNEKISYIKLYEHWGWMIGSGFYTEELSLQLHKKVEELKKSNEKAIDKVLIYSGIALVIIFFISNYIYESLRNILNNYKEQLEKEMNTTIEKEKLLVQQSKMATMGEMIGNIAHQWKQPLSLISMSNGLIKLSREDTQLFTKKDIDESIENINEATKYLTTTIDDFKNFFKPDKEKTIFDFNAVFDQVNKLIGSQFRNNNIEIIKEIKNIELYGYRNEFLQVIINLVKNAKDQLQKVKTNEKLLFIKSHEDENNTYIEVLDSGGGIKEEIEDKIFDSYFTTKGEDGTGIGLYMSNKIIEGMEGTIEFSNKEYTYNDKNLKGASFTIILPKKGLTDE